MFSGLSLDNTSLVAIKFLFHTALAPLSSSLLKSPGEVIYKEVAAIQCDSVMGYRIVQTGHKAGTENALSLSYSGFPPSTRHTAYYIKVLSFSLQILIC
jgi:hypothetical protein